MIKVGIDITPLTKGRTGVGRHVAALTAAMASQAIDAELMGVITGVRPADPTLLPQTVPTRRLPVPARAAFLSWEYLGRPRLDAWVGGLDVYHATNYVLPPLAGARSVTTIHDLAFLIHPEWCSPRIRRYFARAVHRAAQESDAFVACSEATKRDMTALLGIPAERITVMYAAPDRHMSPIPLETARARVAAIAGIEGPYILYVGTVEPRKNLAGLLDAFERIQKDVSHTLVIAGATGWEVSSTLERMAAMAPRVVRPGYVPEDLLPALYSAADLLVMPSHYEGFGLPVVEAMACGCPVVAANTSSLPEVVGDAGLLVDTSDADAMAEGMRRVLSDEDLRKQMREKGVVQASRFTWDTAAGQVLAIYRQLAGGGE